MTRLKQDRTRRSGNRVSANTQDFDVQVTPHLQLCRINANIARNILRAHVGQLDDIADGMARLLLDDVLDSLERLIEVLPKRKP